MDNQIEQNFWQSPQLQDLDEQQRKTLIKQFKKLYAQQMGRVTMQINKKKQVQQHKEQLQKQQQQQIQKVQDLLLKKMDQHREKREKLYSKKIKESKDQDDHWRLKMKQIHSKQRQQNKQSLEKAVKYRKEAETFWSESEFQRKKKEQQVKSSSKRKSPLGKPQYSSQYETIKTNDGGITEYSRSRINESLELKQQNGYRERHHIDGGLYFVKNKNKSHSRKEMSVSEINKNTLPLLRPSGSQSFAVKAAPHSLKRHQYSIRIDDEYIKEHIQKSRHLSEQRQQQKLQKALQKLQQIQKKRIQHQQKMQKQAKAAKQKREQKEDPKAIAQRKKRAEAERQSSLNRQHKKQFSLDNGDSSGGGYNQISSRVHNLTKSKLQLNESIVKHREMKQQIEDQEFEMREESLKANMKKQKKGKLLRDFKEKIQEMKKEMLKNAVSE